MPNGTSSQPRPSAVRRDHTVPADADGHDLRAEPFGRHEMVGSWPRRDDDGHGKAKEAANGRYYLALGRMPGAAGD